MRHHERARNLATIMQAALTTAATTSSLVIGPSGITPLSVFVTAGARVSNECLTRPFQVGCPFMITLLSAATTSLLRSGIASCPGTDRTTSEMDPNWVLLAI
jgi:hypothetical protein